MGGFKLGDVLAALEYDQNEGLVKEDVDDHRFHSWREAHDKLGMDAVLFHREVPLVYFKGIEQSIKGVDESYLQSLHNHLWNHNRVPFVIVVFLDEVQVYNCFASPVHPSHSLSESKILLKRTLSQSVDALKKEMSDYLCREILSGRFVRDNSHCFNRDERVDSQLLDNLQKVRQKLIRAGLEKSIANNLLGRSIFVRYLEDRKIIGHAQYDQFLKGNSFSELLEGSYHETYRLFEWLSDQFNGDMFPIGDDERRQVNSEHLQLLGSFLNREDVTSRQMYFWAYDFEYIPIELISSIYEIFLDKSKSKKDGVYYTPPKVVDFVLNRVIPFGTQSATTKILDPSCGSGIFLVEAFRRLVNHSRFASGGKDLDFNELSELLTNSIYGVDIDEDAIQVAAFSCYLALLDFLKSENILGRVRFPKLKGTNLFVESFFNKQSEFNDHSYSIIVGNPPWKAIKGEEDHHAKEYIQCSGCPPSSKQIALVFLWRASELLGSDGKACLLAPCKSMLFNHRTRQFRSQFFKKNKVTRIVNFSRFRMSLFSQAVSPMAAVFFEENTDNNYEYEVEHIALHPSPLSDHLSGFVMYSDDIDGVQASQVVDHPFIWKTLLWGSSRDHILIHDLERRFPNLDEVSKKMEWLIRCGATVRGSDKHEDPALNEMQYVPADKIRPFCVLSRPDKTIDEEVFHRPGNPEIYKGPHILVGGVSSGYFSAVFLPNDAVFTNAVFGIAGSPTDSNTLKVVCAYLNSSLASYYHFLTSSRWGIERDNILLAEHRKFPCAIPLEDEILSNKIVSLVDRIQGYEYQSNWRPELDDLVYSAYGMTQSERNVIEDFYTITMNQFYSNKWIPDAFRLPSVEDFRTYAKSYHEVFARTLGYDGCLSATIYDRGLTPQLENAHPYTAVSFRLITSEESQLAPNMIVEVDPEIDSLLDELERFVTEQQSESFYLRKNFKAFVGNTIHIVKPAELRFWTRSSAYNDADETFVELLNMSSQ